MSGITTYQAKYLANYLTRRLPANDINKLTASLQDAQVDLTPHQVEAALFAFKSPLSKGAILADEVGLGKTIEAGIICRNIGLSTSANCLSFVLQTFASSGQASCRRSLRWNPQFWKSAVLMQLSNSAISTHF